VGVIKGEFQLADPDQLIGRLKKSTDHSYSQKGRMGIGLCVKSGEGE